MVELSPRQAKDRLRAWIKSLEKAVEADSEQEVRGPAVGVLDATLDQMRQDITDDHLREALRSVYMHEIETGDPVRVVDALHVIRQIEAAITIAPPLPRSVPRNDPDIMR